MISLSQFRMWKLPDQIINKLLDGVCRIPVRVLARMHQLVGRVAIAGQPVVGGLPRFGSDPDKCMVPGSEQVPGLWPAPKFPDPTDYWRQHKAEGHDHMLADRNYYAYGPNHSWLYRSWYHSCRVPCNRAKQSVEQERPPCLSRKQYSPVQDRKA